MTMGKWIIFFDTWYFTWKIPLSTHEVYNEAEIVSASLRRIIES